MLKKLFGSANDRYVKKLMKQVRQVNALEPEMEKLSDEELKAKTQEFKDRLTKGETLDDLLVEAFAVVREAAKRTLHQRHYDVQIVGGIVLHQGKIAEMKTGEGKTLVSTLAVYLNALSGKGVHVVTVNDYLAKRDAEWMGQIYRFLGLTVGCILHDLDYIERKQAYNCDITYGTNSEFGFDYLRDNMRYHLSEMVQRPFNYVIVDEVDSILIDEARTPLIISGPAEDSSKRYISIDKLMYSLKPEHYEKDEKYRQITLTEEGIDVVEELLRAEGLMPEGSLYDLNNINLVHHVEQALKAHKLFTRDVDYIVKGGKVIIVDEFTGRIMDGRRFSDGLHQALEAKEHVEIQAENQTLASVTYQNYFRMYPKLAGMTGTAMTESGEFDATYNLQVVEIPTNKAVARIDEQDAIYGTAEQKYQAILKEIEAAHAKGQPVLVGTTSVEKSEILSDLLQRKTKIRFEVLNAKNHEREAMIIAQAGALGAVTIATNMAGRGTDIKLGGNFEMRLKEALQGVEDEVQIEKITKQIEEEIKNGHDKVISAGGLFVIGTERHENRRIDNQLRGRSGRQGDPGRSMFFVSLEDDLMRIFGAERLKSVLKTFKIPEGERISHRWITGAIRKAQQKVEEFHFDIRKNVLKFDDVMNEQRKVIFSQRKDLMSAENVRDTLTDMRHELISETIMFFMPPKSIPEDWDFEGLRRALFKVTGLVLPLEEIMNKPDANTNQLIEFVTEKSDAFMTEKFSAIEESLVYALEKNILLQVIDAMWKEHLQALDFLKKGIGLRGGGQTPLNEYKKEAFVLFENMLNRVRQDVIAILATGQFNITQAERQPSEDIAEPTNYDNVGRNQPCPCGSGKKFKHCHGKVE
ncbi:MAG: preprotein translocase subunit SecA [Alphaproteobacteria bacterium]|nr:preprotein translocase subunit SecA [Alphaproteobacteria bacterium]